MRDDCKEYIRKRVAKAVEELIEDLEKHPTYLEDGEETNLTVKAFFSLESPWKTWNERPDIDDEGTHLNLSFTTSRTETA